MDTNFNEDYVIIRDIDNYVVLDEDIYKSIIQNINCNYLMILFTITCFSTIIFCNRKPKNDYVLVQDAKPVHGEIV